MSIISGSLNLTLRCHKTKTKKKFTKPQLQILGMSISFQKIMSICKNFEVCETRYIFSKPYENHKNHHNLLLKHLFTNLVLRIVGLDETFHLLENY